ncbi:MAG TPA: TolC family protein [bacterium]|nr:TolC family protein [bacterium]
MTNKFLLRLFYRAEKIIIFSLILVSILSSGMAWAQAPSYYSILRQDTLNTLSAKPTLSDYVRFGLTNNPDIQAAYQRYKSEYEKINSASKLPDPVLSLGYFLRSIETAVGPQEYKLGLMQPLPFFGKLKLKEEIQSTRARQAYQNLSKKMNSNRHQIKSTYYDYYYLKNAIDITQDQIRLLEQWEGQIESKFKTGQSSYPDLIKAQIELLKLEDDLKSLLDNRKVLRAQFKTVLNVDSLSDIYISDDFKIEYPDTSQNFLTEIKKYNPDFQNARNAVKIQKKAKKLARLQYYPDFAIGFDYILTGDKYTGGTQVKESGKDPLVVKFSISLPLWWKKTQSKVKAAHFRQEEALEQQVGLENSLSSQLIEITNLLQDKHRRIQLYQQELIPKSQQLLEVTETAYLNGKSDFMSLIDAQRRHLELTLKLKKSRAEYLKARAALEKLIGRTL